MIYLSINVAWSLLNLAATILLAHLVHGVHLGNRQIRDRAPSFDEIHEKTKD